MKVTNIRASEFFNGGVTVRPGDELNVTHTWESVCPDTRNIIQHEELLSKHGLTMEATWTHSILFDLDGELNHIIGTQKTVDWLRSLEEMQ